jgi:hypothetical protein
MSMIGCFERVSVSRAQRLLIDPADQAAKRSNAASLKGE